jgi:hypothetical protein
MRVAAKHRAKELCRASEHDYDASKELSYFLGFLQGLRAVIATPGVSTGVARTTSRRARRSEWRSLCTVIGYRRYQAGTYSFDGDVNTVIAVVWQARVGALGGSMVVRPRPPPTRQNVAEECIWIRARNTGGQIHQLARRRVHPTSSTTAHFAF